MSWKKKGNLGKWDLESGFTLSWFYLDKENSSSLKPHAPEIRIEERTPFSVYFANFFTNIYPTITHTHAHRYPAILGTETGWNKEREFYFFLLATHIQRLAFIGLGTTTHKFRFTHHLRTYEYTHTWLGGLWMGLDRHLFAVFFLFSIFLGCLTALYPLMKGDS
jgi:hypothetical protein